MTLVSRWQAAFTAKTSLAVKVLRKYVKLSLVSIPSPCGKAYQSPKCMIMSSVTNFTVGETITGSASGARATVVKLEGSYVFYKFLCGLQIDFASLETVSGRSSFLSGTVSQSSKTCPLSRVMRDVIPFDFGAGGYSYRLYRSDGSPIHFGEGNWLLDIFSGVVTFYGVLPSGVSDAAPPSITFYRYVGKVGLNTVHNINGFVGIGTDNPEVSLDVDTTDAVGLPRGTTAQRPDPAEPGYVRWNTETNNLEVYNGCTWEDYSKGTGSGLGNVNIATGGQSQITTIGNSVGTSGVNIVSGSDNISLASAAAVTVNANSSISLQTRGIGSNTINIGSAIANETIVLDASGTNSRITLKGPVNLEGIQQVSVSRDGGAYYFSNEDRDGIWRAIEINDPNDSTTTNLHFQKRISGTYTTMQKFI